MGVCVPVRDMRDTAAFASLVEREGDVTVTKNGYTAIHCLSEERFRALSDQCAKAELLSRMLQARRESEEGRWEDYDSFASGVRERYGL